MNGLRRYFPKAFCQIRKATRLTTPIEVKVREFAGLEKFIWEFAANMSIVSSMAQPPVTIAAADASEQAKADLFPIYPAPIAASNVVKFADRSNAPLAHRSRPKVIGGVSID